jgi:hypothetical protein
VCENHAQTQPYILDVYGAVGAHKALVVEDALFCGACTPRPDPIDLPELDDEHAEVKGGRRSVARGRPPES